MYQANSLAKCRRKRIENVDCWVKPSPQPLITAPSLLELVDLVMKYGQNSCGSVACLELAGERMLGKVLFGLYFICLEGLFKNDIEIGRGCCRCGILRSRGGRLTHVEGMVIVVKDKALVNRRKVPGSRYSAGHSNSTKKS
jgi:hypothetical protein